MKRFTAMALVAGLALAGGCAYPPPGGTTYAGYETRGEQQIRFGVVEMVRAVNIRPPNTGVGSVSGAVLGGIAGSHVGGGSGEALGFFFGTILGSLLGNAVEAEANQMPGVEVTVLLDSGRYIAVVQAADEPFKPGDRVRVLGGPHSVRVTH